MDVGGAHLHKAACTHRDPELHDLSTHQQFLDKENFRLHFQGTLKLLEIR